jgi:hypothetical protein
MILLVVGNPKISDYNWNIVGILWEYDSNNMKILTRSYHDLTMVQVSLKYASRMLQVWLLLIRSRIHLEHFPNSSRTPLRFISDSSRIHPRYIADASLMHPGLITIQLDSNQVWFRAVLSPLQPH